jgi:hypothetical protein
MHLTLSAGEQHFLQRQILISNMFPFSVGTFNLKANRFYNLLQAFLFITVYSPGLLVPTRIVFVAEPGIFLVPKTAWYSLSSRMFKGLGVLVQLGLSGIGKYSFQVQPT